MLRAAALAGVSLGEIADGLGVGLPATLRRAKGHVGLLLELALGATAGSAVGPDFPALGVELKTVPVDPGGKPRETTSVCSIDLSRADAAEWETSPVRARLAHVLWVPVVTSDEVAVRDRRIGTPRLWRPSAEEETILRADFEELIGRIGAGGAERISAEVGVWLHVRPKAASSAARTAAPAYDGEPVAAVPRGFYLRTSFTARVLGAG
jgi:DNA mismatch repair protein MutH